jgi:hypothetical protein
MVFWIANLGGLDYSSLQVLLVATNRNAIAALLSAQQNQTVW